MSPTGAPPPAAALSVVLVSSGGSAAVARTLERLRAQSAAGALEVIVVAPRGAAAAELEREVADSAPFAAFGVVEVDELQSTGAAMAAGFCAARAELVACAEEHSYPEPEWAAALIAAFESDECAAAGAVLENENPATMVSWAHLYTDFGPAVAESRGGPSDELPGHHTAYRRSALRPYEPELDAWLEVEWVLHDEMSARGERLLIVPAARASHLNVSRLGSQVRSEFEGGRAFAASRARLRGWSAGQRLAYALAAPALVVVRLRRTLAEVERSGRDGLLPRLLPALLLGLVVNVAGQVAGYLLGPGDCRRRRRSIELERWRHLRSAESGRYAPAAGPAQCPAS